MVRIAVTSVRMGDIAVACAGEGERVALGLGSCIGLAVVDRGGAVAGLAHIVLPQSLEASAQKGKFADLAVPEIVTLMCDAGAREDRLEAVLAGGAQMFDLGPDLDIGARTEAAVRSALTRARIPVTAAATGGRRARTITVGPDGSVTVSEAGDEPTVLLNGDTPVPRAAGAATGARA